jgi:hypothetical protein
VQGDLIDFAASLKSERDGDIDVAGAEWQTVAPESVGYSSAELEALRAVPESPAWLSLPIKPRTCNGCNHKGRERCRHRHQQGVRRNEA